jgi:hypothetical protein
MFRVFIRDGEIDRGIVDQDEMIGKVGGIVGGKINMDLTRL